MRDDRPDALFVSQTGSGKTLMLLLPMLELLASEPANTTESIGLDFKTQERRVSGLHEPRGLIIVPTQYKNLLLIEILNLENKYEIHP